MTTTDWRAQAGCVKSDPETFFPAAGEDTMTGRTQYAEAKRVCWGCPVRADCLKYALEARLDYGVFGGMTPNERNGILRRSKAAIPVR